jgi:transcription factor IIIB subunit 2
VATTALRMLQSMKRDWISTGRRPAGLCGAAILISARYHGFRRSTHQIVKVVKVCHETIRKRLQEFKKTSVAQLTMQEFEAIKDSELQENDKHGMDPPAFIRNLLKKNKAIKCIKDVEVDEPVIYKETSNYPSEYEPEEMPGLKEIIPVKKREVKEIEKIEEEEEEKKKPEGMPENESLLSSDDQDEIQQYMLNDDEKVVKVSVWILVFSQLYGMR